MIVNPISLTRRFVGLGAMLAALGLGAKSWLDEERTALRRDYYEELSSFYREAGMATCLTEEAMLDTAMARGWSVEEAAPKCPAANASRWLRFVPSQDAPWKREDGFLAAFDRQGCRMFIGAETCAE